MNKINSIQSTPNLVFVIMD